MNVADIIKTHRPRVARVAMMFNGELADQITQARAAWREAVASQSTLSQSTLSSDEADRAKDLVDRLEAQADEETVHFTFRAISKAKLDEIKSRFPPAEDTWERYKIRLQANPMLSPPEFDPEPFSAALIAASCEDPAMTEPEAVDLIAAISDGDVATLFGTAWSLCMQGSDRPLSKTAISGT